MRITLSTAISADGFLNDNSTQRLLISTPEDWADVYKLRAKHDAILVGAETLRCDNPSLLIRDENIRQRRMALGLKPDIAKVTLTTSGKLDPTLRFFQTGDADRYVFSPHNITELQDVATIILDDIITAKSVVTTLEKFGIEHLMVEGGACILNMFLSEGMADTLRLAVNPSLHVGAAGKTKFEFTPAAGTPCHWENLGGMEVSTYTLQPNTTTEDIHYLREAIAESRRCTPCNTSYCVGAVVVTSDGQIFRGYTHETSPTHHAEQEAIAKALAAGAELRGASIYSSMEPCSKRSSEPESCTQLIIRHGFSHVAFALYEPDCFVCCRGALTLREAGINVRYYRSLEDEVRAVNAHLWQ